MLEADELTILTSWAEAIAEVMTFAPHRAQTVSGEAHARAPWPAQLGISEPSGQLNGALKAIDRAVCNTTLPGRTLTPDAVLAAIPDNPPGEQALDKLAHRVFRSPSNND